MRSSSKPTSNAHRLRAAEELLANVAREYVKYAGLGLTDVRREEEERRSSGNRSGGGNVGGGNVRRASSPIALTGQQTLGSSGGVRSYVLDSLITQQSGTGGNVRTPSFIISDPRSPRSEATTYAKLHT